MYYEQSPLRFECTACGRCCYGDADSYIAVSEQEAERIREHLQLTPAWFRRRYLTHDAPTGLGIRMQADGRCVFLKADGRCRIYTLRPGQCRSYPFWPEIVEDAKHWQTEARRCEGINRGAIIPLTTIRHRLKQSQS